MLRGLAKPGLEPVAHRREGTLRPGLSLCSRVGLFPQDHLPAGLLRTTKLGLLHPKSTPCQWLYWPLLGLVLC